MRSTILALAVLAAGCAEPERGSLRDRYDLYLSEPDRAASAGLALGDTEAQAEEKAGKPGTGYEQVIGGHRWTEWVYSKSYTDWEPEDDDVGIFKPDRYPRRITREKLRLTFRDGRLRTIEDVATGRVETDLITRDEKREYETLKKGEE